MKKIDLITCPAKNKVFHLVPLRFVISGINFQLKFINSYKKEKSINNLVRYLDIK